VTRDPSSFGSRRSRIWHEASSIVHPGEPVTAMSMTEFIVRARAAPVVADQFLAAVGNGDGVENLADVLRNALFIAQSHRRDVRLTLVLERSQDYSRIVIIDGDKLGSLENLHEQALLDVIADALRAGETLPKNGEIVDQRGILVRAASFEQFIKEKVLAEDPSALFLLDKKGLDVREADLTEDLSIVLTDHTPMPKKSLKALVKQGLRPISVGPRMLHAAQCIAILLNEVDRQRF